jgi:outer membrane receptor protein involved in Fe transport
VDHQLPFDIVLSATFAHRTNRDLIETVSRDGIFVPVSGFVPGTGQHVTLFDYLNPETDILIYTNPKGLNRTYRAMIISASRQFDQRWQLQGSYVYSRTRGNIDNLGFDESGIGGNTPFFEGHFLDTPNSLVNAQGRLTHDQTHQIKLQGTWNVPSADLSFSANYTFYSGDTWTPRTDCLLTDEEKDGVFDCHEFPQGPVLYFAEPRGSRRLPARNELDFRAEWEHEGLSLIVDVFNVTNQRRPTEVETTADEELGQPATFNFPRNVRLGIGYRW